MAEEVENVLTGSEPETKSTATITAEPLVSTLEVEPIDIKTLNESIFLLVNTMIDFNNNIERSMNKDTRPTEEWMLASTEATHNAIADNRFMDSLARKEGDWRQGVMHEDKLYGTVSPQVSAKGGVLTGANARAAVRSAAGGVSNKIIQLPHSGLVLNTEGINLGRIFELEHYISSSRVNIGMETQGGIFSSNVSALIEAMIQYMLPAVVRHNVKDTSNEELLDLIRITDLMVWVNGFAGATFHNSKPVAIPCSNTLDDEAKTLCSNVYRGTVNINRLYFVDNFSLTKKQRGMLADRTGVYSKEEIRAYQNDFPYIKQLGRRQITDNLAIDLCVPTVNEYLRSGSDWVSDIVSRAEQLFTGRKKENELRKYIEQQAQYQPISQYSCWIKAIVIQNDDSEEQRVTERDDIVENLESLVADDSIAEKILTAIVDFINECTVGVIGLPVQMCPSCNKPLDGHQKYNRIHPVDPISLFFTLAHLKS